MLKQTIQFGVETKDKTAHRIGRTTILQPKTNFKVGSIKWFDDSQLLKQEGKSE